MKIIRRKSDSKVYYVVPDEKTVDLNDNLVVKHGSNVDFLAFDINSSDFEIVNGDAPSKFYGAGVMKYISGDWSFSDDAVDSRKNYMLPGKNDSESDAINAAASHADLDALE